MEIVFVEGGIYVMLKDQVQIIWFGSKENGLFRFVFWNCFYYYEVYYYMNNLLDFYFISDNKILCIDEDYNGCIWIGIYGGGLNLVEEKEDGVICFIYVENKLFGFFINCINSICCMVEGFGYIMLVGIIEGLIIFFFDFLDYENICFYFNFFCLQVIDGLCSVDVMFVL